MTDNNTNIPIAFVPNSATNNSNFGTLTSKFGSNNITTKTSAVSQSSKIDSTVELQITNLIDTIIAPKIKNSHFNCLLIPTHILQGETLDILRKNMLIPKYSQDLFVGYAKDADVLILSPLFPNELHIFDSVSNNETTLSNHLTLSMNFTEFRGKLDVVLEILKIAASVETDNTYQARIQHAIDLIASDIMYNWKRMEDLNKYGNKLIDGVKDGLLQDLDSRIASGDVSVEEINVIIQTIDSAFGELKIHLASRYSNLQTIGSLSAAHKMEELKKGGESSQKIEEKVKEKEFQKETLLDKTTS